MNKIWYLIICLILSVNIAVAVPEAPAVTVTISPDTGNTPTVNVGESAIYTITVNTTYTGESKLQFFGDNSLICLIEGTELGNNRMYSFTSTGGIQEFELEVFPTGPVELYEFNVKYNEMGPGGNGAIRVYSAINAVPELASIFLVSVGLLGLLGLTRLQRRDQ